MKKILLTIIGLVVSSTTWSAQEPITQISGTQASIGALKSATNTRLSSIQSNFVELYSLTASGLPPCDAEGDVRQWDGDSWECTPMIDFSSTSPLNFNSATGVLSLIPWASQYALETWLGWTFTGSGGTLPGSTFTFDDGTSSVASTLSFDDGSSVQ